MSEIIISISIQFKMKQKQAYINEIKKKKILFLIPKKVFINELTKVTKL